MSIKPIDYQITYNNSINEAKDKQNQLNKPRDTHYFMENQLNSEIERNKTKIRDSEGINGKNINRDQEKSKENKQNKDSDRKKTTPQTKKTDEDKAKYIESKGLKIDIFI